MKKKELLRNFVIINSLLASCATYVGGIENIQNMSKPFNAVEVIEKVSHYPVYKNWKTVIKDKSYEASFEENGILLKVNEKKNGTKDVFIPVKGKPEINGGRVVYKSEYGEVAFEGKNSGLKLYARGKYGEEFRRIKNLNSYENTIKMNNFRYENKGKDSLTTGEFIIDTNVTYVTALENQRAPIIASDGTNCLIVWQDRRVDSNEEDIYGTRVSQTGEILDPAGIAIATTQYYEGSPAVTFNGGNYLVVWTDCQNIYGTRISKSGILLDTNNIIVATSTDGIHSSAVASDGTNYIVVWSDRGADTYDIYGKRMNEAGILLDTTAIAICTAKNLQGNPKVAFNKDAYLVAWEDYRDSSTISGIYGARVSQNGTVMDTQGIDISTMGWGYTPNVVSDGTNWFVVWGYTGNIYGRFINENGVALDTAGFSVSPDTNHTKFYPAITFDGTNYLVVWEQQHNTYYDIYGTRVSQTGAILDTTEINISNTLKGAEYPAVAFNGVNHIVVWSSGNALQEDIYGKQINKLGEILDTTGIKFSKSANNQNFPAAAFDGTNYLVVWEDDRNDNGEEKNFDIYGTRISSSGAILDPLGIPISTAPGNQFFPSIAFDGNNYFVVWNDSRTGYSGTYGARVGQSGNVIDTAGIFISDIGCGRWWSTAVAFGDTNYLVVFAGSDIYGARVSKSGILLDTTEIPICTNSGDKGGPSVAFDGNNYFVVWGEERSDYDNIYGTRISKSGIVLDPTGIAISTASFNQMYPSITFDGTNYFVVWEDNRSEKYDIYGTRINTSGQVLSPSGTLIYSGGTSEQYFPKVAFDGTNYLVVWQDYANYIDFCNIYGAQVSQTGTPINVFSISDDKKEKSLPALAKGTGSQILVTYSMFTHDINERPVNTYRVYGKLYPFSGIEENSNSSISNPQLKILRNPFIQSTIISYYLPKLSTSNSQLLTLKLYDLSGRCVKTLVNESKPAGTYTTTLNAKELKAGIYFVKLTASNFSTTKKLILMK
ncbi:MAG: T9SS type A sorting domain-containing protein [bacterium]